jgi:hypothetical protein
MSTSVSAWLSTLQEQERTLLPEHLQRAARFLASSRNPGEGWGPSRGLSTDLGQSALAIEALMAIDNADFRAPIAEAALHLQQSIGENFERLSVDELLDYGAVICGDPTFDHEYADLIADEILQRYESLVRGEAELQTGILSRLLLARLVDERAATEIREDWERRLLARQSDSDGGWPALSDGRSSVIPTTLAVRALAKCDQERSRHARNRGLDYLRAAVAEQGWQDLGGSDLYAAARALRSLGEASVADDERILVVGVRFVLDRRNPDGGWGGAAVGVSTVEATALASLALVSAGENRFVPSRLARAAMVSAQVHIAETTEALARFQADFDSAVKQECGRVVDERDTLRREIGRLSKMADDATKQADQYADAARRLENEVSALQRYASETARYAELPAARAQWIARLTPWLLLSVMLLMAGGITVAWFGMFTLLQRIIITAGTLSIGIIPAFFALQMRLIGFGFTRPPYTHPPSLPRMGIDADPWAPPRTHRLREEFRDFLGPRLPPSLLEELVYRLYGEIVSVPAAVAPRLAFDLARRLGIPPFETDFLARWAEEVAQLEAAEQRLLFDQLRAELLPYERQ